MSQEQVKLRVTFDKYDKLMPLAELKPSKHQRNKHSKEQIERLALIMREHGVRHPIHISKQSGEVCFGHGRWAAAKLNKWKEYPIVYQDFENDEEEYSCVQSDNAIAVWAELDLEAIKLDIGSFGPDFNQDLLGIKDLSVTAEQVGLIEDDEVPEVTESRAKLGDIWQLGNHRLVCGDSTNICAVELLMMGETADMIFTDPPYGIAVENTQGSIMNDQDLKVFEDAMPLLKAFSKPSAHAYVWCAPGDLLIPSMAAFSSSFDFKNLLPVRCTHENKRSPAGAFKYNYEACLFGNSGEKKFNKSDKFKVSTTTLKDERYKGDGYLTVYPSLWDGERATEHNMNIVHPTQKKVEMIEFYLEISSSNTESVLDLFGGSGSTLIACEKTNRKCFMMELDPHYCDVIVTRWEKFTGQKGKLLNGEQKS